MHVFLKLLILSHFKLKTVIRKYFFCQNTTDIFFTSKTHLLKPSHSEIVSSFRRFLEVWLQEPHNLIFNLLCFLFFYIIFFKWILEGSLKKKNIVIFFFKTKKCVCLSKIVVQTSIVLTMIGYMIEIRQVIGFEFSLELSLYLIIGQM